MRPMLTLPAKENYSSVIKKTFLISLIGHSLLFGALSWAFPLKPHPKIPRDEGISIDVEQISEPAQQVAEAAPPPPPQPDTLPPEPEPTPEPAPQKVVKKVEPARPTQQAIKTNKKKNPEKPKSSATSNASASSEAAKHANPTQVAQALPPKATAPAPLGGSNTPKPPYPELARKRNWEGTVRIRCNVDASGSVTGVSVAQSSGYKILDDAALKTVSRWKFKPASSGNGTVAGTVVVPVVFKLN